MACSNASTQPQGAGRQKGKQPADRNPQAPAPAQQPSPASAERNPVGRAQELAQKQFLPPPAYTFECNGADHPDTRQFLCTARLRDISCRGAGTSKRLAKQQAAAELLHQLLLNPTADPPTPAPLSPQLKATTATPLDEAELQRLRTSKRLQSAARAGAEVGGMFRGVRNRKAGTALPPIEVAAVSRPSEQLQELSKAHRFGIQFLPLDGSSGGGAVTSGQHRSVVKLSTMPTIVVVGNGGTVDESREQACRAALEYLGLLTKESAADSKK